MSRQRVEEKDYGCRTNNTCVAYNVAIGLQPLFWIMSKAYIDGIVDKKATVRPCD